MNRKARKSFLHVIHVNGTRGKTGTARTLDACLRNSGFRVFTKTTGSDAAFIDTQAVERPIRRFGPPAISEQFQMLRKAYKERAEIVIIECMAVKPELQKICQDEIIQADIGIITNVRPDHLFEMGPTLDQIAESLSGTIPENGVLFTADEKYFPFFFQRSKEKQSQCILCQNSGEAEEENNSIALELCRYLGLSEEKINQGIQNVVADFGTKKEYMLGEHYFLNLFSANDPQSTELLLKKYIKNHNNKKPVFVYNNREDRPDRVIAFAEYFFEGKINIKVYVIGECRNLAARIFRKAGIETEVKKVSDIVQLFDTTDIVGIGNIKGNGEQIIRELERRIGN